jgi:chromate transporter
MGSEIQDNPQSNARRRFDVLVAFLKIGVFGYGVAGIWGLIQSEIQERRKWLSKERFLEGLAVVQALPGATAMQMCIFAGYQHAGAWGGVLAGLGFMLPAFGIMLVLAALHSAYGALPLMRDAFYGVGPVILGIFVVAVWRLGRNAIRDRSSVVLALAAAATVAFTPIGAGGTFLLAACAGVAMGYSRKAGLVAATVVAGLIVLERHVETLVGGLSGPTAASTSLVDLGVFFFKVGAVTFGGGLTIIAFIQDQVVNQLHWITAEEFLEGLALGQVTPGPIIMVAAFVGYKVAGVLGAAVAAGAIFLPSFILMLAVLPVLDRVRALAWMRAAMRGIGPAVVGVIALSILHLAPHAAPDAFTRALLGATVVALLACKVSALQAALAGGILGIVARSRLVLRLRDLT